CKQTVPSARAFSPHLFERLFCQAGVVRRGTRREGCVRDKQKAQKPTIAPGSGFKPPHYRSERKKEHSPARVPGAGGWQRRPQARADSVLFAEPPQPKRRVFLRRKVLFLLRPLNAGRRLFPRKATCGWFWRF
ncbi:hypothetical protein, partial [Alistipes shahii]|uniref:hypothetical protein n=1 Tax=Alistipes shahii TaxID=328814 RepID=UPI0032BF7150